MADVDLRTLGAELQRIIAPYTEQVNSVKSLALAAPPGSPADGDRYIVAASPTGAWSGHATHIATWDADGAIWTFITPGEGTSVWVDNLDRTYTFDGSAWATESHGVQTDATFHALATAAANGFLSALQFRKFENYLVTLDDFVPGGAALSTANFPAALQAACDAAFAVSTSILASAVIVMPDGTWPMGAVNGIRVKGRVGNNAGAPYIVGRGHNACRLTWDAAFQGRCFWLDGGHNSDPNCHYWHGGLSGFSIYAAGAAQGIYFEHLIWTDISNVTIRMENTIATISGRTGSAASLSAPDAWGQQTLTGVTGFTQDSVNRRVTIAGGATGANNSTFYVVSVTSAVSVKLYNPSGASDANNGALTWTEKAVAGGVMSRGDYTNTQGVSLTNSQNVRFSNVSVQTCANPWFLEADLGCSFNHCVANQSGGYDMVLSRNTHLCWRDGMLQSGGAYTVVYFGGSGQTGNVKAEFDSPYHEGAATSFIKSYPAGTGEPPVYIVNNVPASDYSPFIDVTGADSVEAKIFGYTGAVIVKALTTRRVHVSGTVDPYYTWWSDSRSKYVLDAQSAEGLVVEGRHVPYHAQLPTETTINRLLINRGLAGEIFDPRVASKVTLSGGTNLQALAGLLGTGVSLVAQNSGIYPTWQAANSNIGNRPSWTNVAGAAAAGAALKATLNTTIVPIGSKVSLFVVYRLPSASVVANSRFVIWDDGITTVYVGAADSNNGGHYGGAWPVNGINIVKAADTLPQAVFNGYAYYYPAERLQVNTYFASGSAGNYETSTVSTAAGTLTVMGSYLGGVISAAEIAYVAILKRVPTLGETERMLDCAAHEWPGIARY